MDEIADVVVGNCVVEPVSHEPAFDIWANGATTGARILRARLAALATTAVGFNRRFVCTCACVWCRKELGPGSAVVVGQGGCGLSGVGS